MIFGCAHVAGGARSWQMLTAVVIAVLAFFTAAEPPGTIAYAGARWSSGLQTATSSIYTMRADGSQRRRISTKGPWTDTNPAWSPDGRRIAFGRMDSRGWRILVMGASGGSVRTLVSHRPLAEAPAWSPDGRQIAFAGMPVKLPMKGSVSQQVWIVNVATGRLRVLTRFAAGAGVPAWSPDGSWIAFTAWSSTNDNARADIWRIHPNGSGVRRVVRNADGPAWSSDGKRLAFSRDGDIYTVGADGSSLRRITNTARTGETDPSWSADLIAFASMRRAADQAKDDMLIGIARTDGKLVRTIRDGDPLLWMDAPAWKP